MQKKFAGKNFLSTFAIPNEKCWVRITVSTQDSQSCNRSSILLPSTTKKVSIHFEAFFAIFLQVLKAAAKDRAKEELGDMIFALVNAGRLYKLNPDTALEKTCAKFRRRFTYLEEHTIREGRDLHDMTLAEMDAIWDEGKEKGL